MVFSLQNHISLYNKSSRINNYEYSLHYANCTYQSSCGIALSSEGKKAVRTAHRTQACKQDLLLLQPSLSQ